MCFSETALMADKKGSLQNSDNHGPNAGQNVLFVTGEVEFRATPEIWRMQNGKMQVSDPDMYAQKPPSLNGGKSWLRQ